MGADHAIEAVQSMNPAHSVTPLAAPAGKSVWPPTVFGAYCRDHHRDIYSYFENIAMKNQTRPIDKRSPVSLREISRETARAIMQLDVLPHQRGLVAPNAVSIAQAHFAPEAWIRAIYADEAPVGFVMLEDWTRPGAKTLLLSFVPAEQNPEAFYARFGFERNGEMDGDEVVMALTL